ncbi:Duplicated homeodomain-like superfamily protein [Rhynchospora pubera]|uniref:Duplicated homeodomain-like superfamily protein n=1 Tax=Rhynchospora pubera TaxID=906938 RepID=A0AAV8DX81_9POAL|nr:Duplicated homeodomain-like superfamily protein [Rhynchospora pubera]
MASSSTVSFQIAGTQWTRQENEKFEEALVVYERDTPDRWQNLARFVGGNKSAEDVKRYYELLLDDIIAIESGEVPCPVYTSSNSRGGMTKEEHG